MLPRGKCRRKMEREELKRRLNERLADSSSALVCNAYDFMGLHAPCADWNVRYLTPEFPPLVGEAITIKLDCSTPDDEIRYEWDAGEKEKAPVKNLYYEMISRIEKASLPQVVVIESVGDYKTGAVIGDGMAKTFLAAGAVGCVTNGAVRDIQDVKKTGLKTFGGGFVVNHYSLRWSGLGEPVNIGGLEIRTGDLIHGDGDGLITLPEAGWSKVVRACRYVMDFEKQALVILRRTEISACEKEKALGALSAQYGEYIAAIDSADEI